MIEDAIALASAFGYLTQKEVILLRRLAMKSCEIAARATPVIVNIGAGAGTSALAMREGCKRSFLYSVDNRSQGGPLGGFDGELNAFHNARMRYPAQILGDSPNIGKEWMHGSIDLLFIDGDHSREGITADIEAWFPHVRMDGYIAFHNYNDPTWPDVTVVVNDLMKNQISLSKIDTISVFSKKTEHL